MNALSQLCTYLNHQVCQPTRSIDSKGREVIEWVVSNRVRFVSYPQGLSFKEKEELPVLSLTLDAMKEFGAKVLENGEGMGRVIKGSGFSVSGPNVTYTIFVHSALRKALLAFFRLPSFLSSHDNLSITPFKTTSFKMLGKLIGCENMLMALPAEANSLLNKSIGNYLNKIWNNKDELVEWSAFADKFFFKPYAQENKSFEGYPFFSSIGWATTASFLLGISPEEIHPDTYSKMSIVWNNLFMETISPKDVPALAEEIRSFIRKRVLEIIEMRNGELPNERTPTIIDDWLNDFIPEKVYHFISSNGQEGEKIDRDANKEIEILVDNVVAIMIGMQENFGFIMSEYLRRMLSNHDLQDENKSKLQQNLFRILKELPPAGSTRAFEFDTKCFFINEEGVEKKYRIRGGERVVTQSFFDEFDSDFCRKNNNTVVECYRHNFGGGAHPCPGKGITIPWMTQVLNQLLSHYNVVADQEEIQEPNFAIYFTMKNTNAPRFKLVERVEKTVP